VASRRGCRLVKVGVEAAGHYHRALLGSRVWPAGWEVVELSPARVAEQRRVQGRRGVKTDAIDLEEAITELVLAGHGIPMTPPAAAVTELKGGRCTWPPGPDTDCDEESVARAVGPLLSGADDGGA
jgi:transposase